MDKQALAYHQQMRRVAREAKAMDDREGMDPIPTPQELSEWTATVATGATLPAYAVLRLLQLVRRQEAEWERLKMERVETLMLLHELWGDLTDYGQHQRHCLDQGPGHSCQCGFMKALQEWPERIEAVLGENQEG